MSKTRVVLQAQGCVLNYEYGSHNIRQGGLLNGFAVLLQEQRPTIVSFAALQADVFIGRGAKCRSLWSQPHSTSSAICAERGAPRSAKPVSAPIRIPELSGHAPQMRTDRLVRACCGVQGWQRQPIALKVADMQVRSFRYVWLGKNP